MILIITPKIEAEGNKISSTLAIITSLVLYLIVRLQLSVQQLILILINGVQQIQVCLLLEYLKNKGFI